MPRELPVQEKEHLTNTRPLRGSASSRARDLHTKPEYRTGPDAPGNLAVQRRATESTSLIQRTRLDEPLSSQGEFVSRPSDSAPADEMVSRSEEVTIRFDPQRPWLRADLTNVAPVLYSTRNLRKVVENGKTLNIFPLG